MNRQKPKVRNRTNSAVRTNFVIMGKLGQYGEPECLEFATTHAEAESKLSEQFNLVNGHMTLWIEGVTE